MIPLTQSCIRSTSQTYFLCFTARNCGPILYRPAQDSLYEAGVYYVGLCSWCSRDVQCHQVLWVVSHPFPFYHSPLPTHQWVLWKGAPLGGSLSPIHSIVWYCQGCDTARESSCILAVEPVQGIVYRPRFDQGMLRPVEATDEFLQRPT